MVQTCVSTYLNALVYTIWPFSIEVGIVSRVEYIERNKRRMFKQFFFVTFLFNDKGACMYLMMSLIVTIQIAT